MVAAEEAVYLMTYLTAAFNSHSVFQAVQKGRRWNLSPASSMPSPLTWCRPLTQQRLLEVGGENVSRTQAQWGMWVPDFSEASGGRESREGLGRTRAGPTFCPKFLILSPCSLGIAFSYLITGKFRVSGDFQTLVSGVDARG